jgi:monoterpene epsilon-lactone hydrolase
MSQSMNLVRAVLARQPNVLRTPESIQAGLATGRSEAPVPKQLRRKHSVEKTVVGGFPVTTLTPRNAGSRNEIIYLHGGAYVNPIVGAHWSIISALMKRTGATVTAPMYGLAPQHTISDALPFLDTVVSSVAARAGDKSIYLVGDSAGAGLALALALRLRDSAGPRVGGLFLFSPWLDPSMSNPAAPALVPYDVMLDIPGLAWCGQQWAGDVDVRDPSVSPMFADLTGLPPTFVYQGGHDIFLADAIGFTTLAHDAGMPVELRLYPDGFHVFVGATFLPESRAVLSHVAEVINTTH